MWLRVFVGFLALCHAALVGAQALPPRVTHDAPRDHASSANAQALYKGVAGNLLELVPLEESDRLTLQRTSAVIGNPLSARSLAIALGLASGPLMVVRLIWGFWAAENIKPADNTARRSNRTGEGNSPWGAALPAGATDHAGVAAPDAHDEPGVDEPLLNAAAHLSLCTPVKGGALIAHLNAAALDGAAEYISSDVPPAAGLEFNNADREFTCEACYGLHGRIPATDVIP